jgi:hypothetical protein
MSTATMTETCGCLDTHTRASCLSTLDRPRYFPRQLITPAELNLEAAYFAERLRRHNRLLHGWGVVCGAQVCRVATADGTAAEPWKVRIRPGFAIDGHGNEISITIERVFDLRSSGVVVGPGDPGGELRDPWCSDVWVDRTEGRFWIAVCYKECLARPVRVQPAGCGCDDTSCEYSRLQDGYEVHVLDSCPPSHQGPPPSLEDFQKTFLGPIPDCPPCPDDPCVVLAAVDIDAEGTITGIDNCSCRRMVASAAPFWWRCSGGMVTIDSVTIASGSATPGNTASLRVKGTNLVSDATVELGPGVTVSKLKVTTAGNLTFDAAIANDAAPGDRTLTITNPDCSFATSAKALTVAAIA